MSLPLSVAQAILSGALAEARALSAKSLAVIVLDAGANPVVFAREDGASLFRFDIARAKAFGALGMGDDTRVLTERAAGNPVFFQSVSAAVSGNIAFSPGGVLIRDLEDRTLGAIGVSGDTGDLDERCALAGLRAAGYARDDEL